MHFTIKEHSLTYQRVECTIKIPLAKGSSIESEIESLEKELTKIKDS
jgi:hypothetical protein